VLPVRWLYFSASFIKQKGVQLKWDIAEDNNVKQYYVERSTNSNNWDRLASIPRKTYPDPSHTLYDFIDYEILPGKTFYRIVQEDATGKMHSSEIRQVIAEEQTIVISPNPAKDKLNIKQKNIQADQADIYDCHGRLILSTRINHSLVSIDISKLIKGNYFLKLRDHEIETAYTSFIKL
jgi:hypothetical protein